MNILEFDSIEKSFRDKRVLSSIYMHCAMGRVVALLGRNGAGKSTLMQIVFGSLSADCKSIRINKKSLLKTKLQMTEIGYLPQHRLLPTGIDVHTALADFGIKEKALTDAFPDFTNWMDFQNHQLSGGWLRIFETFLILKSKKLFVLLDEPFSDLMPLHIERVKELILQEKQNKGIIISDHLFRHALDLADTTYLLKDGRTHLITSPSDLVFRGYVNELA